MNFVEWEGTHLYVAVFINSTVVQQSIVVLPCAILAGVECLLALGVLANLPILGALLIRSGHFHLNLRLIYLSIVILIFVAVFSRILLIIFQFQWLRYEGEGSLPLLAVAATFGRFTPLIYEVACFCPWVCIERLVASRDPAEYERNRSPRLAIGLTVVGLVEASIVTYLVVFHLYENYKLLFAIFFPAVGAVTVGAFFCLRSLLAWNLKRHREMTQFQKNRLHRRNFQAEYLSRRFQLEENIEVLQLMNRLFRWSVAGNITAVFFGGIPTVLLDTNSLPAQLMLVFFDLTVMITIIVHMWLLIFGVESFRRDYWLLWRFVLRIPEPRVSALGEKRGSKAPFSLEDEKNMYFTYYQQYW
ncbi:unnamed protein product, partial [Mesorhabditis spiculigera]